MEPTKGAGRLRKRPRVCGPVMEAYNQRFTVGMFYASRNVEAAALPLPQGMKGGCVMTSRTSGFTRLVMGLLGGLALMKSCGGDRGGGGDGGRRGGAGDRDVRGLELVAWLGRGGPP